MKNNLLITNIIISSKTIMEYASEYGRTQKWSSDFIDEINQIQTCKRYYLPCELIGMFSWQTIEYCIEIRKRSQVKWKID